MPSLLILITPLLLFVQDPLFDDDLARARSEQLSCTFVVGRQFLQTAQNERVFQIACSSEWGEEPQGCSVLWTV